MAKSKTKQRQSAVGRAFKRAWKLLGRLERRLQLARTEEEKRTRQLGNAAGKKAAKRSTQLGVAQAEVAQVEGLLTELSELIAANARAQAGQVVKDVAHEAAGAVRDAAATEPVKPKPIRKPPVAKPTAKRATGASTSRLRVRKPAASTHPPTGPEPTAGA